LWSAIDLDCSKQAELIVALVKPNGRVWIMPDGDKAGDVFLAALDVADVVVMLAGLLSQLFPAPMTACGCSSCSLETAARLLPEDLLSF
jgi:hypothetical protein